MLQIGITGGIGSGKSTVARIIAQMGYPIFDSDKEAKKIMVSDPQVIKQIKDVFGESAYNDKQLNRSFIAQKIFNDSNLKIAINNIVHPAVREHFKTWCKNQTTSLVFNESAIMFETGAYTQFDYTILIRAQLDIRIQRVVARDNLTEDEVLKRIQSQWTDIERSKLASFIIDNNADSDLQAQTEQVIKKLLALNN